MWVEVYETEGCRREDRSRGLIGRGGLKVYFGWE